MLSLKSFPKVDAHIHFNADRVNLLKLADKFKFSLLTINTEVPDFPTVDTQRNLAKSYEQSDYSKLFYATTVSTDNIFQDNWAKEAIEKISLHISNGACGVKFWKNIGMSIQRSNGSFLMLDDPIFRPVFDFLEENQIPVLGHQGEPKNCWLPVEQMTVKSDRDYFSTNPQYHMYLHKESPNYWAHINVRDRILERHPNLHFVGLHLASLEWSLDEISHRLDKFPKLAIDLAERFAHLYYHAARNRNKVKHFFERYQDRIIYGTDIIDNPQKEAAEIIEELKKRWKAHWLFLSSNKKLNSPHIDDHFFGLNLADSILQKVYFSNAYKWYLLEE